MAGGAEGVSGEVFRRVRYSENIRRAGLLGHASVLTATANGVETSPVVRGVWVLENILGTPPAPPPPDVPPIEPDTRGAVSIREQLAKHRDNPSCADCHAKIDSWGLLFENYSAAGTWKKHDDEATTATLPDGTTLNGIAELKAYIRREKADQFARGLTRNLLRYGLGRSLSFTDNEAIDDILKQAKQDEYRLQSLIGAVVSSPLFSQR